jgi:hypothetical protein
LIHAPRLALTAAAWDRDRRPALGLEVVMDAVGSKAAAGAGPELEERRAALFAEGDRLAEAARAGRAGELAEGVARLSALAAGLFADEERSLRRAGSPSLERHVREHRRFLADLQVFQRDLGRGGGLGLPEIRVARHVAAWLEAHLSRTDQDGRR